ncbi:S8 family serine peptidase [Streptomyces sp. NPDC059788]|uniref:S8 family serine peptidase n=1 Tax=Streptomyces sp. NPDC059788 TaxID=3346948 RepID=UPI00365A7138
MRSPLRSRRSRARSTGGSASPNYPAAEPGVLAVGAVGSGGRIWEDSNYGPHVLLAAPGEKIGSVGRGQSYRYTSGTSDSTAYVSGLAALLRAKYPQLSAGQIANRLTATAQRPSGTSDGAPDAYYGYGVIRSLDALTEYVPAASRNGPLVAPQAPAQEQPADGNTQPGWPTLSMGNAGRGWAAHKFPTALLIPAVRWPSRQCWTTALPRSR